MAQRDEFDVCVIGTGAGGGVMLKELFSPDQLETSRPDDFRVLSTEGPVAGANLADWPISYDEMEPDQIYVVPNWVEELKHLVPTH